MKKYILIVLVLTAAEINAQTIITDRPSQTESSSTVEKGSLQIESGLLFEFTEKNSETERQILAPIALFRYGITEGMEIRVLNQYERNKNQTTAKEINGISDLEIGAKIQLLRKENINAEIAFVSHLIIPTGSKDLTIDKFGTINKISISHKINENIGIGYNLGYNYFGTGNGDLTYSLAVGIGVTERAAVYIEPYGDLTGFEKHIANFDASFTYLLRNNFQLDFSLGTGLNHTMRYASIGFSYGIR